jgi:hypothetical protein
MIRMAFARRAALVLALLVAAVACTDRSHAQDLEPRSFANAPVGLNFLLAGYSYIEGDVALNPTAPVKGGEVDSHSGTLAYIRAIDVAGMSGKIGLVVPFAQVSGEGEFAGLPQSREISGLGDPRVPAPALTVAAGCPSTASESPGSFAGAAGCNRDRQIWTSPVLAQA